MYPNAGASQRAQGRSPGLGGRGTHRRGVTPGAVATACASRPQEAGGGPLSPHRNTYGDSLGAEAGLYYLACRAGRAGAGGELGWLPPVHTVAALLTAVPPGSASSTFALSSSTQGASAACHVGLNHESTAVHGVCKGLWHADAALDLRLRCASRDARRASLTRSSGEGNQPPPCTKRTVSSSTCELTMR